MGAILVSEVHLYSQLPMYLRLDRKNVEFMAKKGWAYFSRKEAVYERTSPTDKEIYLWAFSRGNNNYVGNIIGGEKIPALIVEEEVIK